MRTVAATGLANGHMSRESAGTMAVAVSLDLRKPPAVRQAQDLYPVQMRAMALWPRLNRRALRRCGNDPARIAAYVSHRTRMPVREIEALLTRS
jgi:hypothetical protein